MIETNTYRQAFFFNPLKSPLLWAFCGAHLLFAIILGDIHAFAPDEMTYTAIARDAYHAGFSTKDILGWRGTQVWFLQIAYLPTRLFSVIGLPGYLAIRFESVLLCAIAFYLLLCLLRLNPSRVNRWLIVVMFLTPSIFLWMTLGLRECFIFLSLATICAGLVFFIRHEYRASFIFLSVGNLVLFETKQMLFLISVGALVLTYIYSVFKGRSFKAAHLVILASIALPMIIFPVGTKVSVEILRAQLGLVASTGQAAIAEYAESIETGPVGSGASTSEMLRSEIQDQPKNMIVRILKITGIDQKFAPSTIPATTDTNSNSEAPTQVATPRSSKLDVLPASVSDPLSVFTRSLAFLFTPIPFFDNGSFFVNVVALEAPLWWLFYVAVGFAVWRRFVARAVDELVVYVLGYGAAFLLFSALTEINVGTLTRHRSVLLIPFLFLILGTSKKSQVVD